MKNNIIKIITLLFYCLPFLVITSCVSDKCSDIVGSPPPYQGLYIHFIDKDDKDIQLDWSLISIISADEKEKIEYHANSILNFLIGIKNPILSNTITITYDKEQILELEYEKRKASSKCNSDSYFIEKPTLHSLSDNYQIQNPDEDTIEGYFFVKVMK
ncbi:hypothetical protein [Myroides odoratus]|uniref:Lipoprotein n=1 Tax=Myroides odoratus TaxID=256 RepID=A0A9Q7E6R4_MYROD|nr:hypothetical protein [Myroides odoratus]EHQ41091.1 hypothetical protein Myrod_0250 [Myroides odoratus DSM 2801]EKB08276.1 hypothetical protein HMPREF9716_01095 [Myroides odoratus CIP 103059]QQT98545.1 hypothetical protein I6I88_09915 [Myroides odoratus]WQD59282.1 hypothetical protein U0010_09060 [Myroides odoratus]STZ32126.1 Uncharacterised protein [Myroides odoratus]